MGGLTKDRNVSWKVHARTHVLQSMTTNKPCDESWMLREDCNQTTAGLMLARKISKIVHTRTSTCQNIVWKHSIREPIPAMKRSKFSHTHSPSFPHLNCVTFILLWTFAWTVSGGNNYRRVLDSALQWLMLAKCCLWLILLGSAVDVSVLLPFPYICCRRFWILLSMPDISMVRGQCCSWWAFHKGRCRALGNTAEVSWQPSWPYFQVVWRVLFSEEKSYLLKQTGSTVVVDWAKVIKIYKDQFLICSLGFRHFSMPVISRLLVSYFW